MKTGPFTEYFPDGEIMSFGSYNEDKLENKFYEYYQNGMLKTEAEYRDGIPVKKISYSEEGIQQKD